MAKECTLTDYSKHKKIWKFLIQTSVPNLEDVITVHIMNNNKVMYNM